MQINIPDAITQQLSFVQSRYNINPDQLITKLLAEYLQDLKDGEEAIKILAENNPTISLDDIIKEYGLED